jgi:hypothetical protein
VLQEARIFHDPNLDPRRCSQVGWLDISSSWCCCFIAVSFESNGSCRHSIRAGAHIRVSFLQVITKLLYLLHQGETFTKASTPSSEHLLSCRRSHACSSTS